MFSRYADNSHRLTGGCGRKILHKMQLAAAWQHLGIENHARDCGRDLPFGLPLIPERPADNAERAPAARISRRTREDGQVAGSLDRLVPFIALSDCQCNSICDGAFVEGNLGFPTGDI
jgi:hypothetical protein